MRGVLSCETARRPNFFSQKHACQSSQQCQMSFVKDTPTRLTFGFNSSETILQREALRKDKSKHTNPTTERTESN